MNQKPAVLVRIEATAKLVDHLVRTAKLDPAIAAAAKAKLGADLADALRNELGEALLAQKAETIARLEKGELQSGDVVRWVYGNEEYETELLHVDDSGAVVRDNFTTSKRLRLNRWDVSVSPSWLEEHRAVLQLCIEATSAPRAPSPMQRYLQQSVEA